MNNNLYIHESDGNVISAKKTLFEEMCLNTFLSGLREPFGSNIRAMRPKTLAEAFTYCIQEQNMFYRKVNVPHLLTLTEITLQWLAIPYHHSRLTHNFNNNVLKWDLNIQTLFRQGINIKNAILKRPQYLDAIPKGNQYQNMGQNNLNSTPLSNSPPPEPIETSSGNSRWQTNQSIQSRNTAFRKPQFHNIDTHDNGGQYYENPPYDAIQASAETNPTYPENFQQLDQFYEYGNEAVNCIDDQENFQSHVYLNPQEIL